MAGAPVHGPQDVALDSGVSSSERERQTGTQVKGDDNTGLEEQSQDDQLTTTNTEHAAQGAEEDGRAFETPQDTQAVQGAPATESGTEGSATQQTSSTPPPGTPPLSRIDTTVGATDQSRKSNATSPKQEFPNGYCDICESLETYSRELFCCRDCVDMVMCAACLKKLQGPQPRPPKCDSSHSYLHLERLERNPNLGMDMVVLDGKNVPLKEWLAGIKAEWNIEVSDVVAAARFRGIVKKVQHLLRMKMLPS